jgi:hypothetical protein
MTANYPQIVYTPSGGSATTITFTRGPQNLKPYFNGRVHDNLSTSGKSRERVVENLDILIAFEMQHQVADGDMPGWAAFLAFALAGGTFSFYPNQGLPDNYNCVLENANWEPKWNAPKKYASTYTFRVLQDSQAPSDPGVILRRLYGVTT